MITNIFEKCNLFVSLASQVKGDQQRSIKVNHVVLDLPSEILLVLFSHSYIV